MIRAELIISGLVQGVFYRASACEEGERLGLAGEVRNLRSGEVHAVVEGERVHVEAFIAWCRKGPPQARVEEVKITWSEPLGSLAGFRISR